jgi:hypothetical protein
LAADPEKWSTAFGSDCRCSEASSRDDVERPSKSASSRLLSSQCYDFDPLSEAEQINGVEEKI